MSDTPKRVVPVTVDVSDSGEITCDPNPVPIDQGASSVLITFTLSATGYRFKKHKAIAMDVPQDDFPYASWTLDDTQACLFDRNKDADTLKYTVTLVNTSTGKEISVDPEIKNGGGGGPGGD
jgi:hypothetical protein